MTALCEHPTAECKLVKNNIYQLMTFKRPYNSVSHNKGVVFMDPTSKAVIVAAGCRMAELDMPRSESLHSAATDTKMHLLNAKLH